MHMLRNVQCVKLLLVTKYQRTQTKVRSRAPTHKMLRIKICGEQNNLNMHHYNVVCFIFVKLDFVFYTEFENDILSHTRSYVAKV